MNANRENRKFLLGAMLIILWGFAAASTTVAIKLAHTHAVPSIVIVFFIYICCFIFLLPLVVKQGFKELKTEVLRLHAIRAVAGAAALLCLTMATQLIPLVDANLLYNTVPLFMPIVALFWLRDKISRQIWLGILIGFVGIIFIIKPDEGLFKAGDLIGLSAGLLSAIAYVVIRELQKSETVVTILFYYFFFSAIAFAPLAIIFWQPITLLTAGSILIAGVAFSLANWANVSAYKLAKPSTLAPFNYSIVIFAGLMDWLFWNHIPDLWTVLGVIIVAIGAVFAILSSHQD